MNPASLIAQPPFETTFNHLPFLNKAPLKSKAFPIIVYRLHHYRPIQIDRNTSLINKISQVCQKLAHDKDISWINLMLWQIHFFYRKQNGKKLCLNNENRLRFNQQESNQKQIPYLIFTPKTFKFLLMDPCHICKLKTKHIRRIVKNLIEAIRKTTSFSIKSFKDHSQENPLSKVLNNFLKGNMAKSGATQKCKHHTELKEKIMEYLSLQENEIMRRCQIILMSQIKTNYTLDTISLQMRLVPFRFPFATETLKLSKGHSQKPKQGQFNHVKKDNKCRTMQDLRQRKEEEIFEKQGNWKSEKDLVKIEATHIEEENQQKSRTGQIWVRGVI